MAEFPANACSAICLLNLLAIRCLQLWFQPMGPLCLWQCLYFDGRVGITSALSHFLTFCFFYLIFLFSLQFKLNYRSGQSSWIDRRINLLKLHQLPRRPGRVQPGAIFLRFSEKNYNIYLILMLHFNSSCHANTNF